MLGSHLQFSFEYLIGFEERSDKIEIRVKDLQFSFEYLLRNYVPEASIDGVLSYNSLLSI